MANTYRQYINNIQAEIRQISADSYIPPRFIYYEMQTITGDFLKKDNDAKRKLSLQSDGWSEIQGIKLEEVPVISCPDIDVRLCDRMMKSVLPLPKTYTYTFGDIIKHVASPNFSYFFDPTTPRNWRNLQKQPYIAKNTNKYYFFFIDGYIYLPIPKNVDIAIEELRMEAYFIDKHEVDKFKSQTDCYDCKKIDLCKSPLDYEVVAPFYLLDDIKKELLNRLSRLFIQIPVDEYSNMNQNQKDSQIDKRNAQ